MRHRPARTSKRAGGLASTAAGCGSISPSRSKKPPRLTASPSCRPLPAAFRWRLQPDTAKPRRPRCRIAVRSAAAHHRRGAHRCAEQHHRQSASRLRARPGMPGGESARRCHLGRSARRQRHRVLHSGCDRRDRSVQHGAERRAICDRRQRRSDRDRDSVQRPHGADRHERDAVDFAASALDLADGSLPVACAPASGTTFPIGSTRVACSSTDAQGNRANGGFQVTVNEPAQAGRMIGDAIRRIASRGSPHAPCSSTSAASRRGGSRVPVSHTVLFSGAGRWNGVAGYTFEAQAVDAGEPGRGHDRFALAVRDAVGRIGASVDAAIANGNVQSIRIDR
jgi:hypothetical protein